MTSTLSNSLIYKIYNYIRVRVDAGHWTSDTGLMTRKNIVQTYVVREMLECFAISIMPRCLVNAREFALPHLKDE